MLDVGELEEVLDQDDVEAPIDEGHDLQDGESEDGPDDETHDGRDDERYADVSHNAVIQIQSPLYHRRAESVQVSTASRAAQPLHWNSALDIQLIASFSDASKNPIWTTSGGKNLRAAGWIHAVTKMKSLSPAIVKKDQLVARWKRLKSDYTDYNFILSLSGYGADFDDAKWAELDANRSRIYSSIISAR